MAITKAHEKIQGEKAIIREQIRGEVRLVLASVLKVPHSIVNGSHNDAVEWKNLAESASNISPHYVGPPRGTADDLRRVLSHLQNLGGKLRGQIYLRK